MVAIYLPENQSQINEALEPEDLLDQLQSCEQRELSYFDEALIGYIGIHIEKDENIISNTLDIHIQGTLSGNHQIVTLQKLELNPLKQSSKLNIYKFNVFINYPRLKLDDPILKFKFQTSVKNKTIVGEEPKSDFIASYQPLERRNLLNGYRSITASNDDSDPVILDSYIKFNEIETPLTRKDEIRNIKYHLDLPIIRVLNIRIKNFKISKTSIISTIELEISSNFASKLQTPVSLYKFNYKSQNNIVSKFNPKFPIELKTKDSYRLSYQLNLINNTPQSEIRSLIELQYSANNHHFKTSFITNVDFLSVNQLGSSSNSSLNISRISSLAPSLSVKFIGSKVQSVGDIFKLKVIIQNNSKRERDLIMVFNSLNESFQPTLPRLNSIIQPTNSVVKNYLSMKTKSVGVISLVNEVKFSLNSNDEICENEIKLVGLESGVFKLSGIKLIDLLSGESMNCEKLELIIR
ncbi:hypothetical protein WICMUC_002362 [Wickerhamomyces mucosus]|uniref:Uncharacterized protein n=1 Tax=Wickerhamomyces mucosus TaxID=1378264 RepID=A0A9P8PR57_9ASCO|nr:hypothetical protein WICMUC_002362 [Wickerhamomyces mucosus]